jgi:hypothetical protein
MTEPLRPVIRFRHDLSRANGAAFVILLIALGWALGYVFGRLVLG